MSAKPTRTIGKNGQVTHWWQALMAVPQERDSVAYERLRRVWFDHTRFGGASLEKSALKLYASNRRHEFHNPSHETHLTVSLWENFALFSPKDWLPRLYNLAGLPFTAGLGLSCRWSYEWEGYRPKADNSDKSEQGMCDVVVSYRDEAGEAGVLVVEAKNLTKEPGVKELRLDYYLTIREIAEFGERGALLYLVDESKKEKSMKVLGELPSNVALITWQDLAGLQIELAQTLEAPEQIRSFVAGSIQFQFCQHNAAGSAAGSVPNNRHSPLHDCEAFDPIKVGITSGERHVQFEGDSGDPQVILGDGLSLCFQRHG